MLKKGSLPTQNFSGESASNTTKPRPGNTIEKHKNTYFFKNKWSNPYKTLINRSRISHHESAALH